MNRISGETWALTGVFCLAMLLIVAGLTWLFTKK